MIIYRDAIKQAVQQFRLNGWDDIEREVDTRRESDLVQFIARLFDRQESIVFEDIERELTQS